VTSIGGTDSKSASVRVVDAPPIAPTVTGSATGRTVTFDWGNPDYSGLPGTMSIDVSGAGYPGGCPTSATGAGTCSFVGDYGTTYTMQVTVQTAGGTDANSASVTVGSAPPPPPPVAPAVSGSATGADVTFTWGPPDFNGVPGTMTISVTGTGYPGGCPASATGAGSCTFTGLYSTAYTITVVVQTAGGSDTSTATVTTDALPVPPSVDPTPSPPLP
jgi:hypothetical protein